MRWLSPNTSQCRGLAATILSSILYFLSFGVKVHSGPNSSVTGPGCASAPQHYRRGIHCQWVR